MKKILLSSFLIIAFILYAIEQRLSGVSNDIAVSSNNSPSAQVASNIVYKDGQYTGKGANAFYGTVQVQATVQNGKIVDVQFLNHPQDRNTSIRINNMAMPKLKTEAIQAQSANVDIVSGATDTSQAFQQSLSSALSQAA